MTDAKVLILHGYQHHRAAGHWLRWLTSQLQDQRIPVQYPQLPDADMPQLGPWLELAHRELEIMGAGERIIVAHSLGGILWHHLVATGATADRVLMVAPPSHERLVDVLGEFSLTGVDEAAASRVAPLTLMARERDPFRATPVPDLAAQWHADAVVISGEGHINLDDGHGPFEPALDWMSGAV